MSSAGSTRYGSSATNAGAHVSTCLIGGMAPPHCRGIGRIHSGERAAKVLVGLGHGHHSRFMAAIAASISCSASTSSSMIWRGSWNTGSVLCATVSRLPTIRAQRCLMSRSGFTDTDAPIGPHYERRTRLNNRNERRAQDPGSHQTPQDSQAAGPAPSWRPTPGRLQSRVALSH